jgi:hypothetical protein
VHRFDRLPKGVVRGQNEHAFRGGIRLWERNAISRVKVAPVVERKSPR